MGRHLLRRKSLTPHLTVALAAVILLSTQLAAVSAQEIPAGAEGSEFPLSRQPENNRSPAIAARALSPTIASGFEDHSSRRGIRDDRWIGDTPAAQIGPLPSRQGHAGPAVYPLTVPSEPSLSHFLAIYRSPAGLRWIQTALDRGAPYRYFVVTRLAEAHLPPELYFLAMIESTFVVHAVSKSGAVGLWQFMLNSVGDRMTINDWVDERRDFWKSTEAAIEKLAYNHQVLGDWLLAIAAYNGGLGYISSIIQKTGIHDFWRLANGGYLTAETAAYVPKFLAVVAVAEYAGRNGLAASWAPPTHWTRVSVTDPIDLDLLAEQAAIPLAVLRTGNAELNWGVTPPGRYQIKVPERYKNALSRALASSRINLVNVRRHVVHTGDTFWELAQQYQLPVTLLQQFNPLVDPETLHQGTELLIPILEGTPDPQRLNSESPPPSRTTGVPKAVYTVAPGDTLWSVSRAYGVTPERLAAANGMTLDQVLPVGRVL
ncbi:MAG TPA: LysM peptidoglycan-binding domain-containing protein, partial [Spirochaetia bacterium]|nr:LysM peptidoglycan-binding domain-containing protein [Spirochaetia bacterium]